MARATPDRLRAGLERAARRDKKFPPPQILVRSPGWTFEFGDQDLPFHAASVGKVMTATLAAMFVERGDLRFDTPLGDALPAAEFADLPAAPGVDLASDVTLDHLLSHTHGMPDFFEAPRGYETEASAKALPTQPDRHWTPADLIDQTRGLPPVGRPGERFAYGDTGFVLAGRMLEEVSGEPFNTLLRKLIFEPAGMERSSTPYSDATSRDEIAELRIAPFWIGRHELSRTLALSADWAGGGIVATLNDLVRFQRALHGGELIEPATLARLSRPRNRFRRGIHYGTGLVTVRFGEFMPPFLRGLPEPIGGVGHFATHMFYYPEQDAHVVLNFNAYRRMNRSFQTHIQIAQILAASS